VARQDQGVVAVTRTAVALLAAVALAFAASAAEAAMPLLYKNCTNFNKKYPHGVGKRLARDRTTSGDTVTNFKRSTLIYNTAMRWNRGLDCDKDGVACERK